VDTLGCIGLTLIQASVAARAFMSFGVIPSTTAQFFETVLSLTAGTMFLIWLGEQITEKGVGNGISFIIFAGIVNRLPQQMYQTVLSAQWYQVLALLIVFVATVWVIIYVTQGERRIPVKYAPRQAGKRMVQAQRSHLPLKMAAAGVIPIIFAVSIVLFPGQIANWYLQSRPNDTGGMISVATSLQTGSRQAVCSLQFLRTVGDGLHLLLHAVIFDVRDLSIT
jgi:preprotein translocase subunit SecY